MNTFTNSLTERKITNLHFLITFETTNLPRGKKITRFVETQVARDAWLVKFGFAFKRNSKPSYNIPAYISSRYLFPIVAPFPTSCPLAVE